MGKITVEYHGFYTFYLSFNSSLAFCFCSKEIPDSENIEQWWDLCHERSLFSKSHPVWLKTELDRYLTNEHFRLWGGN